MTDGTQTNPATRTVRFGVFEFRPSTKELFKYGHRIRLQEQPAIILQLLLERPGETVTREQLQRDLWPGTTFVEYDAGLNTAISKLRSALGDSSANQLFIERVPKLGYRFVAPVSYPAHDIRPAPSFEEAAAADPAPPVRLDGEANALDVRPASQIPGEQPSPPNDPQSSLAAPAGASFKGRRWLIAAAVALTLSGGYWSAKNFFISRRPASLDSQPVVRYTISLPPTQVLGKDTGRVVALSGDGRKIAYIANTGTGNQIFFKLLGQDDFEPLPDTRGAIDMFFSPDGKFLAFWANGRLTQLDLETRRTRLLLTWNPLFDHPSGVWGDDGSVFFGNAREGRSAIGSVLLRAAPGKPFSELHPQRLADEEWLFAEQPLMGGERLLVTRSVSPTNRTATVLSLTSHDEKVVMESAMGAFYLDTGHLIYSWKGDLMAAPFSLKLMAATGAGVTVLPGVAPRRWDGVQAAISKTGTLAWVPEPAGNRQLYWVDRQGHEESFDLAPSPYDVLALSPKGTRLLIARRENGHQSIWVYDMTKKAWTRLLSGDWENCSGAWSPDESQVIVSAILHGEEFENLYQFSLESLVPERVAPSTTPQFVQDWTARSGVIFTDSKAGDSHKDLMSLSLKPGEPPHSLVMTHGDDSHGSLSPDGLWLAYSSDISGSSQIYVRRVPGQEAPVRVTAEGGTAPRWSPRGNELFFRGANGMWSMAFREGRSVTPHRLFTGVYTSPTIWNRRYVVSPDASRFLMMKDVIDPEDFRRIHVVVNWSSELVRRVPSPR